MKILLLNSYDVGGAARAVLRLNKGLQSMGIASQLLVQFKNNSTSDVMSPQSFLAKCAAHMKIYADAFPVRFYKNCPLLNFTPAFVRDNILKQISSAKPDIIHLNWMANGFLKLENIQNMTKPLVWTLLDSWPFTGGCHIPFECTKYCQSCGACPVLGAKKDADLSRWVYLRKQKAWENLNLTLVAPSNWLADCAKSSSLFQKNRIVVIPIGLDTTIFKPCDKSIARCLFNLPDNKQIILFGAINATSDRRKGYHLLIEAVKQLATTGWSETCELVVFGSSKLNDLPVSGIKTHYLGRLDDDSLLASLYSAADVMVVPSIQEPFGQTASESMACGTPVVCFDATGPKDIVDHKVNGYKALPFDATDLAAGIKYILNSPEYTELSRNARNKVVREYDIKVVAQKYIQLYEGILLKGAR